MNAVDMRATILSSSWNDGHIESMSGFNVPLGFSASEVYEEGEYEYRPGDVFLLYSDGVTEARNPSGKMFGIERLQQLLSDKYLLAPQLVIEAVRDAVTNFVGSTELADDLTCVCIKIPADYAGQIPPPTGELEISSNLGELAAIRAFIRGFCERRFSCDMDAKELGLLELAVSEVASNIIKHSYHGRTDRRIWIRVSKEQDILRVRLTHTGDSFQISGPIPRPSLDEPKEGGFGLFIISRLVTSIEYGQDAEGRQYVEFCKRLTKSGG